MLNFKSKNPKLLISQYYDFITRLIDVYTEEQLSKSKDDDIIAEINDTGNDFDFQDYNRNDEIDIDESLIEIWSNERKFGSDPYYEKSKYNCNINTSSFRLSGSQQSAKLIDYFNKIRDELLECINKSQAESFAYYQINREKFIDFTKTENIWRNLFAKKSMYVLELGDNCQKYYDKLDKPSPYRLYLIVLDFYQNPDERKLLRYLNVNFNPLI